jgi:hypothetical protein
MVGVASSAPSQTTSPGESVLYRLLVARGLGASKSMCLVLPCLWIWPCIRIVVSRVWEASAVASQGPMGLQVSECFAPQGAVLELPGALADIVADGRAPDTAHPPLHFAMAAHIAREYGR